MTPPPSTRPEAARGRSTRASPRAPAPDLQQPQQLMRGMSNLSLHPPTGTRRSSRARSSSTSPPTSTTSRSSSLGRSAGTTPQPGLRKRASMSALTSEPSSNNTPLRRKSSLLSLPSSPTNARTGALSPSPEPEVKQPRPAPPPQDPYAQTAVVLQDACYDHKYARPKTTAAQLADIVERPERLAATVLGVACAQVRLGKSQLQIIKTDRKGSLSDPEVQLVHANSGGGGGGKGGGGKAWPERLGEMLDKAGGKVKRGECEIPAGMPRGDLYLNDGSRGAMEGGVGAVYEAVDMVMREREGEGEGERVKRVFVGVRPPGHHCGESTPSGFCFLNNVHIAIAHAAKEHGLTHAVILDFDLHHGDGSQAITWSLNDLRARAPSAAKSKLTRGIEIPHIAYLSLHDINSFPCESGDIETIKNASLNLSNAHNQFIHNTHLRPFSSIPEFWSLYTSHYRPLLDRARDFLLHHRSLLPDHEAPWKPAIFVSAGFDASEHEAAGMQRHGVSVPTDFFARFTADTVKFAEELCDGRVVSLLEGGYSDRALTSGVLAHISALAASPPDEAAYVPSSLLGASLSDAPMCWDSTWWDSQALYELEVHVAKMTARPLFTQERKTNFMTPTTASINKANDKEAERKLRRLSSIQNLHVPPPPPKPWEEIAWELAQRFIPEYSESVPIPALEKKEKRERHSIAVPQQSTMTLRARKPANVVEPGKGGEKGGGKGRRKTTVGIETAPTRPATSTGTRAPSRVASSRAPTRTEVRPAVGGRSISSSSVAPPKPGRPTAVRKATAPTAISTTTAGSRGGSSKAASSRGGSQSVSPPPNMAPMVAKRRPSAASITTPVQGTENEHLRTKREETPTIANLTDGVGQIKLTYKNRDADLALLSATTSPGSSVQPGRSIRSDAGSIEEESAADLETEAASPPPATSTSSPLPKIKDIPLSPEAAFKIAVLEEQLARARVRELKSGGREKVKDSKIQQLTQDQQIQLQLQQGMENMHIKEESEEPKPQPKLEAGFVSPPPSALSGHPLSPVSPVRSPSGRVGPRGSGVRAMAERFQQVGLNSSPPPAKPAGVKSPKAIGINTWNGGEIKFGEELKKEN